MTPATLTVSLATAGDGLAAVTLSVCMSDESATIVIDGADTFMAGQTALELDARSPLVAFATAAGGHSIEACIQASVELGDDRQTVCRAADASRMTVHEVKESAAAGASAGDAAAPGRMAKAYAPGAAIVDGPW